MRTERVRLHRVFFALWPDEAFRARLSALAAPRIETMPGRRLAGADWHVTLCFVGSVSAPLLAGLEAGAGALATQAFALRFDRIEFWPEARVVALTASAVPAAAADLARALREMARALGLTPDEKPLRPHITLMRGVRPVGWQMARGGRSYALETDLTLEATVLHLAESRAQPTAGPRSAQGVPSAAPAEPSSVPAYASIASWRLGA